MATTTLTTDITTMTAADFAMLSVSQLKALTSSQWGQVVSSQLTTLPAEKVAALALEFVSPQALTGISTTSTSITFAAINGIVIQKLSPAQIAALTNTQISALTAKKFANFLPDQLSVLSPNQLTSAQISELSAEQVDAFSTGQLAALLNFHNLSADAISGLTTKNLAGLSAAKINSLNLDKLAALIPSQLNALTTTVFNELSSTTLGALSPETLKVLNANLPVNVQIFSVEQIAALTPEKLASFSTQQLQAITAPQAAVLRPSQLAALPPEKATALSSLALAAIRPQIIKYLDLSLLDSADVAALTTKQIVQLTKANVAQFNSVNAAGLTSGQINAMKLESLKSLSSQAYNALQSSTSIAYDQRLNSVDNTPPATPIINDIATDNIINLTEKTTGVIISGTAEANATVRLTFGNNTTADVSANSTGSWSYSIATNNYNANDGSHTVNVIAIDTANNQSQVASKTFTIDTQAPAAPVFSFAGQENYNMSAEIISTENFVSVSSLDVGATWKYSLKNNAYINGSGNSFSLPPDIYAPHTIQVIQIDAAGNQSLDAFNAAQIQARISASYTNGAYDASAGDVGFEMAIGTYTFTITNFAIGDSIYFPAGNTPTLTNSNSNFSDGVVEINYSLNSNLMTARITGLTIQQDSASYELAAFKTIFGANSITTGNFLPTFNNTLATTPAVFDMGSSSPVVLDSTVEIFDAELTSLNSGFGDFYGSTLTLQRQGGANPDDFFDLDSDSFYYLDANSGTVKDKDGGWYSYGTYTNTNGILTINFLNHNYDETSRINTILSAITYSNTNSNALGNNIAITWSFNDGSGGNVTGITNVAMASLTGGAGNDVLTGSPFDDFITDIAGSNTVEGLAGNDRIEVNLPNVNIVPTGNNIILGGDGNDTIKSGQGSDSISGGAGNDSILTTSAQGGMGNDTILGDAGNDRIQSGLGNDSVSGGIENDSIFDWGGSNTIDSGDGNDYINLRGLISGNNSITGGMGDDQIIDKSSANNDTIYAGDGNDNVATSYQGHNFVDGESGNDTIQSYSGNDFISGGIGNDSIRDTGGDNTLTGGAGNDDISSRYGNDSVSGDDGNDTIIDTDGLNTISGGSGNDTISGGHSSDSISGDAGNDSISGGNDEDTITGNDGDDRIYGNSGNDSLSGGAGSDILYGGAGTDTLVGETENDHYYFTNNSDSNISNFDHIIGEFNGALADMIHLPQIVGSLILRSAAQSVNELTTSTLNTLLNNPTTGFVSGTTTVAMITYNSRTFLAIDVDGYGTFNSASMLIEITNPNLGLITEQTFVGISSKGTTGNDVITGSIFDDSIEGLTGDDSVSGLEGNDLIYGAEGNDSLLGGSGDDTFYDQAGNDFISGEDGNDDIFDYDGSNTLLGGNGDDHISGGSGTDSISGGVGNDLIDDVGGSNTIDGGEGEDSIDLSYSIVVGINSVNGGSGNDYISGGLGDDILSGDSGNDEISGNVGNDSILGNDGDDHIQDNEGFNTLSGGAGNDTISTGDTGSNTIYGGAGNDIIDIYGSGSNTIDGGIGVDYVSLNNSGIGATTLLFAVGANGAAPSETTFDTIFNFGMNQDVIDFTVPITIQSTSTSPVMGTAQISETGLAIFSVADDTLIEKIVAVENAIHAGTVVAGEAALFTNGADSYIFISDAVAGVNTDDVLIKLENVVGTELTLSNNDGNITAVISPYSIVEFNGAIVATENTIYIADNAANISSNFDSVIIPNLSKIDRIYRTDNNLIPLTIAQFTAEDVEMGIVAAFLLPNSSVSIDATSETSTSLASLTAEMMPKIATGGLTNLTLSSAYLDDYQMELLLSKATDATVVATGMTQTKLNVIATNISKVAAGGITGVMALTSAQDATQLNVLFSKDDAAANDIVVATGMAQAQLDVIAANTSKVATDGITGEMALTSAQDATELTALFSKDDIAADDIVVATGMAQAQLDVITANISKVATDGITGSLNLTATQFATLQTKVNLDASVQIIDTSANIQANLAALVTGSAKIDSINSTDNARITFTAAQAVTLIDKLSYDDVIVVSDSNASIQANWSILQNSIIDSFEITGTIGAETITGGYGNDVFIYPVTANLFTSNALVDSIDGSSGIDSLLIGTNGTSFVILNTDVWSRATNIESIIATTNTAIVSVSLDATAQTTGINRIDLSAVTTGASLADVSEFSYLSTTLIGGTGADTLIGGAGVDFIAGGLGIDTLTGGDGADIFVFDGTQGVTNNATVGTFDTIPDFVSGIDKLQFTSVIAVASAQQTVVQTAITQLSSTATTTDIANAMSNANTTDLGVSFATFNGDTYVLFERTGANTAFTVTDDIFIRLSGITTLPTFATDVVA